MGQHHGRGPRLLPDQAVADLLAGLLLSIAILSINLIGDAARDALDPKMKQRGGREGTNLK